MLPLEDLGSAAHASSAMSYGRDTAAFCAAKMAVHACERVLQSARGALVLFLMAAPADGQSAVVLYGGQNAQNCSNSEQNNIATGMRRIMGSLRATATAPVLDATTPPGTPADSHSATPRPPTPAHRDSSNTSRRSTPSRSSDDLQRLHRAGGLPRSGASTARRPVSHGSLPRRVSPTPRTTRPIASFPGLLSFAPMLGPGFIDKSDEFVVTRSKTVTVSAQLSLSLLERLRELFPNHRGLCKLFLQLIRVAVNDFLTQLPLRSSTSTQATKYLPKLPWR